MKKKKKNKGSLVVLFVFLGLLVAICVYLTIITVPTLKHSQIGQMINYCHNRGSIEFYVEGKKMAYDEIKVVRETQNDIQQKQLTEDCEFAFFNGVYGLDKYIFSVDKESSDRLKDIEITFTNFNENWWNVNNFDIKFDIVKKNGKISLIGECYLNGEKIEINQIVQEKEDIYCCEVDLK